MNILIILTVKKVQNIRGSKVLYVALAKPWSKYCRDVWH